MATTSWPTRSLAESPSAACGRLAASAWTTARSVHGSLPTTRPASSRPSPRRTRTRLVLADDVVVGEQEAVRREQDAGAGALPPRPRPREVDDGRPERLGDADDDARIGVEGLGLVGGAGPGIVSDVTSESSLRNLAHVGTIAWLLSRRADRRGSRRPPRRTWDIVGGPVETHPRPAAQPGATWTRSSSPRSPGNSPCVMYMYPAATARSGSPSAASRSPCALSRSRNRLCQDVSYLLQLRRVTERRDERPGRTRARAGADSGSSSPPCSPK